MDVEFSDDNLRVLADDATASSSLSAAIVKAYRRRIQFIRSAADERDLYAMRSLHFEKLKGKRESQRSMRLNDQWRLILEIVQGDSGNIVRIIAIEDYH